ncbi:MAG: polyphosphate polymerase domain-containing protein [Clostridia bacterium]|nr:polyphosphate polymerase domain-containing protein [Clostridia bacterium]
MAERREEKFLIGYEEYSIIASRVRALLEPDKNGENGKYSICSMYFDDAFDTALAEKEDGNAVHIKFRLRTYGGSKKMIRLERKTKRGIVTEKHSAQISESELEAILSGDHLDENADCFGLVSEMRAKGFKPAISVRYDRESYIFKPLGIRITFDKNVDSLPPEKATLFGDTKSALPAIGRDKIIMEVKYSERCPAFIRKAVNTYGMQLSVSKYALCRNAPTI